MDDSTKLLHDLVNEYARSVGMSPLTLDEEGRCSLLFDDKFSVTLASHPETGALVLVAELGPIPADLEHDFCQKMLQGNYFWQHTGGLGTLALAPDDHPNVPRTSLLMYQTPLQSLDFGTFHNRLSTFVDTAEAWIDYLADFEQQLESNDGRLPETGLEGPMIRV
ncbi:hypothetical protein GC197_16340 [bacterium]|nr:hypothetical protein [bacterium]